MTIFDDIRKDREAGTPGDWASYKKGRLLRVEALGSYYEKGGSTCVAGVHDIGSKGGVGVGDKFANASRIARVPRLERIALEMEQQIWIKVGEYLAGQPHSEVSEKARRGIEAAIKAAFRAACGEGE